ncbi:MAG: aldehyde dehydrogenase, partial [Rubritepida sp.]|nr:aldehyde dehydrogenase [Rubritepida sp.]
MNAISRPSRRNLLASASAALGAFTLGFRIPLPSEAAAQTAASGPAAAPATPEVNAWVVVKPDDTVVIRIARSEMGQGTLTGLAQLVAEELECDWAKVTTEYPTPGQNLARGRVWGNMSTGGSRGIRESNEYVRKGGAAARMMLVQAAANEWAVPVGECQAAASVITHMPSGRTTTFGRVAEAAGRLPVPTEVPLKDPANWKLAGRPVMRLDTAAKLNGSQVYGMDLKLPGMLNAAIHACPVFGGKVRSVDSAAAERMPGVKRVLRVGDYAVAVVADTWWRARSAFEALPVVWDEGPNATQSSARIAAFLAEGLDAEGAFADRDEGDAKAAIAGAARRIEAVYATPYLAHATMEPMNCTARISADRGEAWVPTQNAEAAHAALSETSGLPLAQCEVYRHDPGGGF